VSVGGQQGEAVEQQVEGTRITRRRREGPDGAADLQQDLTSGETPRHPRRGPRDQVGLASEVQIERLEPPGGVQQERGSIAGKTRGEGDVGAHQVDAGALELVERHGVRRGQESERRGDNPSGSITGKTEIGFEALTGPDGSPTTVKNAMFGFAPEYKVGKSSGRSSAFGLSFEPRYGESADFEFSTELTGEIHPRA
jgi:hypothetical protein